MVHFVIKYLKTRKGYEKSDNIFRKFNLFSIGMTFKIMGINPTIVLNSWKLVVFHFFQVLIVVYGSVRVYFSLKLCNSCYYSTSLTFWVEKVKIWKFGRDWTEFGLKTSIFTKKSWFFAVFSIFKQGKKPIG